MKPWTNAEKLKVVRKAADMIVKDGWNKNFPLNALYHAHFKVLPENRHEADRELFLGATGRADTIINSVQRRVKKIS